MEIAVYSGSFDPIHTGHAMVANFIAQWGGVDELWLLVSRLNPLKSGREPASDSHRLAMASLVADGCTGVRVSDFEMHLPTPSYTYVTLCKLRDAYPGNRFRLVIGSDNWNDFHLWRDSGKIISEFGLIVYPRPGYEIGEEVPEGVTVMEGAPLCLVSSTFIRKIISDGGNANYFLPLSVASYIKANGLYEKD